MKLLISKRFAGETEKMNLFQALTNAMDIALDSDPSAGIMSMSMFTSMFADCITLNYYEGITIL